MLLLVSVCAVLGGLALVIGLLQKLGHFDPTSKFASNLSQTASNLV